MKKKKRKYAKCPSCETNKHRTEMRTAISEMEEMDRLQYKNYNKLGIDTYEGFIDSDFGWACDACLQSKKAIKGSPTSQNYCWHPNYAHFDSNKICTNCGSNFIFSKEEKKYWYESLKFWIDSEPVNCLKCRREIRHYKSENKILSEILRNEESEISISELEKVVEIYTNWQIEQKVKYYQSVIIKKKNTRNSNA